ncbi:MAG: hypothetical protein APF81_11305 [Desulfosporosinus sp. BRH_c37]|nr:MAG: hypothetical protein APF81_11305 [Desulfosporosinus sp. BRH_c37]
MNRLQGKVAIVTGAAGGQGSAEAKLFAAEGAKVVLTDVSEAGVLKVAAEIQELGGEALALVHDVSSEQEWKNVISQTVNHFGALNILVNNAGIYAIEGIEDTSLEVWEKLQEINTRSVFLGMKYAIPEMRKAGGGSIINVSSIFGIIGSGRATAYTATKGAIRSLSKTVAVELAKDEIRVNSIHPGIIATPMIKTLLEDPVQLKLRVEATPLPRLGKPEDIAYGALFLASDESSFVTGTELIIDGGYSAR